MTITADVIRYEDDANFKEAIRLNFYSVADQVLAGTFPANITTPEDKQKATDYAVAIYSGNTNVHNQMYGILAQGSIQSLINSVPPGDVYGQLPIVCRNNFRNYAGIRANYL